MTTETNPPKGARRHNLGGGRHGAHAAAAPGRVRWRRFGIIFIPAAALSAGLLALTANGALAASFAVSGQQFEVSADNLTGTGFEQFGAADLSPKHGVMATVESEIGSAKITNLCQSLVESLPLGLGDVTLTIKAGNSGTPVQANSLVIDANQLSGDATFGNIQIGQDASTLNEAGDTNPGSAYAGDFGQQADTISINNLQQVAYTTSAATFTLPGFSLNMSAGNNPCFTNNAPPVNSFNSPVGNG